MSDSDANALISQDDLMSALAEIEGTQGQPAATGAAKPAPPPKPTPAPESSPSDKSTNVLVAADELQRAMSEVASLSEADAALIPDLDDGNENAPQPTVLRPAARVAAAETSAGTIQAGNPDDASTKDAPAIPAALPNVAGNPGGTTLTAGTPEADGFSFTPSPLAPSGPSDVPVDAVASPAQETQPSPPPVAAPARPPAPKKPRFVIGKKTDAPAGAAAKEQAEPAPAKSDALSAAAGAVRAAASGDIMPAHTGGPAPAEIEAATDAADAALPTAPTLGKRVYRGVEHALEIVHKPLQILTADLRNLLGCVSAATIVISLTAYLLLPVLMPHRDAISFVREKRYLLDHPPPKAAPEGDAHGSGADTAASAEGHGGKGSGHGSAESHGGGHESKSSH